MNATVTAERSPRKKGTRAKALARNVSIWPTINEERYATLYTELKRTFACPTILEIGTNFGLHLKAFPVSIASKYTGVDLGYYLEFARLIRAESRFLKSRLRGREIRDAGRRAGKPGLLICHTALETSEDPQDLLDALIRLTGDGWTLLIVIDPLTSKCHENCLTQWSFDGFQEWITAQGKTAVPLGSTTGDYRSYNGRSEIFLIADPEAIPEEALALRDSGLFPLSLAPHENTETADHPEPAGAEAPLGAETIIRNLTIPLYIHGALASPAKLVQRPIAFIENEEVTERILTAKARAEPFSIVRLGNGEARVIGYPDFVTPLWVARSFRNWFATREPERHLAEIRSQLLTAVAASDLVGLPAGSGNDDHWRLAEEMLSIYGCMPANGLLCRHNFHIASMKNRFFETLIAGEKSIGVISPHDLRETLQKNLGIGEVKWHPLAGQAKFFGQDGHKPHYPDTFEEIRRTINVARPGEIFLVGAGPLGKIYCHWIKQAGGIGLDVGSILDVWAGYSTRSGFKKIVDAYKLDGANQPRGLSKDTDGSER